MAIYNINKKYYLNMLYLAKNSGVRFRVNWAGGRGREESAGEK